MPSMATETYRLDLIRRDNSAVEIARGLTLREAESIRWSLFFANECQDIVVNREEPGKRGGMHPVNRN